MGNAANHRAHRGQALALHNLLLQFSFDRDIAHRNNDSADLSLGIHQLAARGAHGPPASIAVPRPILRGGERLLAGNHVVVKRGQFRRMIFQISEIFFPSMSFGSKPSRSRARELTKVYRSSRSTTKIRSGKLSSSRAAEFLLLRQLPLHLPLFGDVNQSSLVADDVSRRVPNRARGIEKDRGRCHPCAEV